MAENKEINAYSNQRIVTVEDNLNKKIDGLKNDFEHKWDNLQDSIENHINQQQCPEEECLSDTMVEKHSEQQLQEEMIEEFVEVVEGLSESSSPLPVAPSIDQVYILPSPAAQSTPKTSGHPICTALAK